MSATGTVKIETGKMTRGLTASLKIVLKKKITR